MTFVSPDLRFLYRESLIVSCKFHSAVCTNCEDGSEYSVNLETGTGTFERDSDKDI